MPRQAADSGYTVQSLAAQISADFPLGEGVGLLEYLQFESGVIGSAARAWFNPGVWSRRSTCLVRGEFLRFHVCFLSHPRHHPGPTPSASVNSTGLSVSPHLGTEGKAALENVETDWEWIVVDDHSRDGTLESFAALARSDPRLREACGPYPCRRGARRTGSDPGLPAPGRLPGPSSSGTVDGGPADHLGRRRPKVGWPSAGVGGSGNLVHIPRRAGWGVLGPPGLG